MTQVFIGLGSNQDHPRDQIQYALQALAELPETQIVHVSSIYKSRPHGIVNQADFYNAAACLETELTSSLLLSALQSIEKQQKRVRDKKFGPRTIDLDILLYGEEVINNTKLTVPHYAMLNREFVLYPLLEIAPDLILPNGISLSEAITHCPRNGLELIEPLHTEELV